MDNIPSPVSTDNKKGKLFRCFSSARYGLRGISSADGIIHANLSLFPLADFYSVSFGALQFAIWTHPKRIYLVGLDTVPNGSFDGRQNSYNFSEMLHGYLLFKEFIAMRFPEIDIISVNPIGLKGLFHDVYTSSYLSQHKEIQNVEILT